jgi:two-component system, CitB family, response regulator CitT
MLKVAIAEDDFRVAQIQEQFLQKIKGVKVAGKALNAKETMELLEREEVDLLLLDVYMPDELGTELLPTIRDRFPHVDIIMITAATEKSMLEKSIRNGVCNYLIKPVTLEKFIEAIEDYKKKRQMLDNHAEVNQSLVDAYFGKTKAKDFNQKNLPSGIDAFTLQKVKEIMESLDTGITIEGMGEKMGASRTTARRYLEYLVSIDECTAELEYGIVGRPERKYYLA